jgi:hypothetical protein
MVASRLQKPTGSPGMKKTECVFDVNSGNDKRRQLPPQPNREAGRVAFISGRGSGLRKS